MPDLIVKFACNNPEERAEEFQHHLTSRGIMHAGVQPEHQGSEIWLNYPNVLDDTIERIASEAHPWCLDRGLVLMRNSPEGAATPTTILLIADLLRAMG